MSERATNRTGKVTEYKSGHHYLTYTEWEDGHCEIEVHRCIPELLWHSCDQKQLDAAFAIFDSLESMNLISEREEGDR